MSFKASYVGIFALIFGIIAVVAVFLDWGSFTWAFGSGAYSGWEIFDFDMNFYSLIVLALGVISALLGICDIAGIGSRSGRGNMIWGVLFMVFGVLVIALSYLAYSDISDSMDMLNLNVKMAYGLYIEFIAGAGMIISGILALVERNKY